MPLKHPQGEDEKGRLRFAEISVRAEKCLLKAPERGGSAEIPVAERVKNMRSSATFFLVFVEDLKFL